MRGVAYTFAALPNFIASANNSSETESIFETLPTDYAGPLTEIVLVGVLALRTPGKRLEWDSANLNVTNARSSTSFMKTEYRNGWTL